jgi:hypothetical protein
MIKNEKQTIRHDFTLLDRSFIIVNAQYKIKANYKPLLYPSRIWFK